MPLFQKSGDLAVDLVEFLPLFVMEQLQVRFMMLLKLLEVLVQLMMPRVKHSDLE